MGKRGSGGKDTISHTRIDTRTNLRIWKPISLSVLPCATPVPRTRRDRPGAETLSVLEFFPLMTDVKFL